MNETTDSKRQAITLYVSGDGANSTIAVDNLRAICRRQLGEEQPFELIDINQSPQRAQADDVMYTPLLVIRSGDEETRFLGNLSRDAAVIRAVSSLRHMDE